MEINLTIHSKYWLCTHIYLGLDAIVKYTGPAATSSRRYLRDCVEPGNSQDLGDNFSDPFKEGMLGITVRPNGRATLIFKFNLPERLLLFSH